MLKSTLSALGFCYATHQTQNAQDNSLEPHFEHINNIYKIKKSVSQLLIHNAFTELKRCLQNHLYLFIQTQAKYFPFTDASKYC